MRYLVARLGAIGDSIITTPLVSHLKSQGHEVYYLGSETAQEVLKFNPHIDKFILHIKDSIASDKLGEYFESVKQAYECDVLIDLCESIEVNLATYPSEPRDKLPKNEKRLSCDKNYYEETMDIAKIPRFRLLAGDIYGRQVGNWWNLKPEMYFSNEEDVDMRRWMSELNGNFVILWGLSGSARQKTYPFVEETIHALNELYSNLIFITVGDESCQILEYRIKNIPNVICKSGLWTIRQSILAAKYVNLVISPDTGLLHGSGCFDTPKIGLFTATTINNVTKHFKNDFSIEAQGVGCSPCFKLIYSAENQCTLGDNKMPICMAKGIPVTAILDKFRQVYEQFPEINVIEVANG